MTAPRRWRSPCFCSPPPGCGTIGPQWTDGPGTWREVPPVGFLWAPLMPPPISNQRASRSSTGRARLRQIWSWFRQDTNGHGPAAVRAHTPDQRARRSPNTHAMPCARWHCPLGVHGHTAPLHGPSAQASPNGAVPSSTEIPVVAVMPDDPSPLRLCIGSPMMPPGSEVAPVQSHHPLIFPTAVRYSARPLGRWFSPAGR